MTELHSAKSLISPYSAKSLISPYMIFIGDLKKDMLFYSLYKSAKLPRFFSLIDPTKFRDLPLQEILKIFEEKSDKVFDKVGEKMLHLDLSRDFVDPWKYDNQYVRGQFSRVVTMHRRAFTDIDFSFTTNSLLNEYNAEKNEKKEDNTPETKTGET